MISSETAVESGSLSLPRGGVRGGAQRAHWPQEHCRCQRPRLVQRQIMETSAPPPPPPIPAAPPSNVQLHGRARTHARTHTHTHTVLHVRAFVTKLAVAARPVANANAAAVLSLDADTNVGRTTDLQYSQLCQDGPPTYNTVSFVRTDHRPTIQSALSGRNTDLHHTVSFVRTDHGPQTYYTVSFVRTEHRPTPYSQLCQDGPPTYNTVSFVRTVHRPTIQSALSGRTTDLQYSQLCQGGPPTYNTVSFVRADTRGQT